MEIRSKLNVGQKVYWKGGLNKPSCGVVEEIQICVSSDGTSIVYVIYSFFNPNDKIRFNENVVNKRLFTSDESCRKNYPDEWKPDTRKEEDKCPKCNGDLYEVSGNRIKCSNSGCGHRILRDN